LIWDTRERLLILKPTYKKGWTIPGGQIDADGESPWAACRRESFEEVGLALGRGRLVCVDFRPPRPGRPGGLRFVFDCGSVDAATSTSIRLQEEEIEEHRFVELGAALDLLSAPLRRRVRHCAGAAHCVYLEDGRPVPEVE
jgi:8-oxo-dGTP pyrophosphatase MutT (NUDIX family)